MSLEALIDRYCEAWSLPNAADRAQALHAVWATGASYSDPTVTLAGADALLAHIDRVRASQPYDRIVRTSRVNAHGVHARFAWQMVLTDGTRLPEGLDIVRLSGDASRIESIIGFFGPLKPL